MAPLTQFSSNIFEGIRQDSVERLFDWRERQKVGSGSFGAVYSARCSLDFDQLKSSNTYAVKCVTKEMYNSESKRLQLQREIDVQRLLKGTRFVQLYDVFQSVTSVFMVMELVIGPDLVEFVRQYRLTEEESVRMLQQITEGLSMMHQYRIAHLDVKLENILIDKETKQIKLCDFGFARIFDKDIQGSSPVVVPVCGSLNYLAPELLQAHLKHEELSTTWEGVQKLDIYAVGVIAYTILGRAFPFPGATPNAVKTSMSCLKFSSTRFEGRTKIAQNFCQRLLNTTSNRPSALESRLDPWLQSVKSPKLFTELFPNSSRISLSLVVSEPAWYTNWMPDSELENKFEGYQSMYITFCHQGFVVFCSKAVLPTPKRRRVAVDTPMSCSAQASYSSNLLNFGTKLNIKCTM